MRPYEMSWWWSRTGNKWWSNQVLWIHSHIIYGCTKQSPWQMFELNKHNFSQKQNQFAGLPHVCMGRLKQGQQTSQSFPVLPLEQLPTQNSMTTVSTCSRVNPLKRNVCLSVCCTPPHHINTHIPRGGVAAYLWLNFTLWISPTSNVN